MLDFLSTILKAAPAIQSLFAGETSAPLYKQQRAETERQAHLTDALTNINNPIFKNLYGQYEQQGNEDVARVLAEAQGQNRMAASMGRVPLLSRERGGEDIFRALIQGKQQSSARAGDMARQNINAALGGSRGTVQSLDNVSGYGKAKNAARDAAYGGIGDLLGGTQMQIPTFQQSSGFDEIAALLKKFKGQSVFGNDYLNDLSIKNDDFGYSQPTFPSIRGSFSG